TLPILGHALPLSTAAPILQLMDRHLIEVRLRWHGKIQSFKSKKSEVASARTVLETCGAGNLGAPRIQYPSLSARMTRVCRFQSATFVPGYWAASAGGR